MSVFLRVRGFLGAVPPELSSTAGARNWFSKAGGPRSLVVRERTGGVLGNGEGRSRQQVHVVSACRLSSVHFFSASSRSSSSSSKKAGDVVPEVLFKCRQRIPEKVEQGDPNPYDWVDKHSGDFFKNKRSVLFALPGAFTPTCSAKQLPSFDKAYEEIKSYGVDEVYCLSVNDAFVMRAWAKSLGMKEDAQGNFEKVKFLPDGACAFTEGMGMKCRWTSERGFGDRSWRYACVINDGKLEWMQPEDRFADNSGPDPYEKTDAKHVLEYLASVSKR